MPGALAKSSVKFNKKQEVPFKVEPKQVVEAPVQEERPKKVYKKKTKKVAKDVDPK